MPKTITFIVHGRIKKLNKLLKELQLVFSADLDVKTKVTTKDSNGEFLTNAALLEGTDFLIAVGGDGTINEVVNGLLSFKTSKKIAVGILPYGRGNDFVRTLGTGRNLHDLLDAVKRESFVGADVGLLKFVDLDGLSGTRYFINIADVGLGGVVTKMVRTSTRLFGADLTYFIAIVRSLFDYQRHHVMVKADDFRFDGEIISLCMANGKYLGSGLGIAPHADLFDGKAEVVILGKVGIQDYFQNLMNLRKGIEIKHPNIYYLQSTVCEIEAKIPCPIDVDGEFIGFTPLSMTMIPGGVNLIKTGP